MVKLIVKQILDKSKLVLNNPVNLRQTKLDKYKLVLNKPFDSYLPISYHGEIVKQILDKSKLVLNNPVNSRQTSLNLSETILSIHVIQN